MTTRGADLLEVIEAAYAVDSDDRAWLQRLTEVARPFLDRGLGLSAFQFYRREPERPPQIVQSYHIGIPEPLSRLYRHIYETMDPEMRSRPFSMGPCVSGSQVVGSPSRLRDDQHMQQYAHQFGMRDSLWVTAMEPSGHGAGFHAGRTRITRPSTGSAARWGRVAAHLSAAVRLRHRLKPSTSANALPDAVFAPDGKVLDAAPGPANDGEALPRLRQAVRDFEMARGPLRREAPDEALAHWKALVDGRWSLIDQFETDGRRFIVARENAPAALGPEALTTRERQVVGYARLGHENKLIAYELGIAHSTVRVLLARAAAKLGVHTRAELIRATSQMR